MKHVKLFHPSCGLAVFFTFAIGAGCRPDAEIRNYEVPNESRAAAEADSSQSATHRMLSVVVPVGDKAWFLKIVGTNSAIDSIQEQVDSFLATLRFPAGAAKPEWELPDGWQEKPGSGMRAATIEIPADGQTLEMSVSALPWTGEGQGGLLANVNRWRGQMQLPPIGPAGLGECTRELSLQDDKHTATLVDLSGDWQEPNMLGAGVQGAEGTLSVPSDHSTVPGRAPRPATGHAAAGGLQLEAPEGWVQRPANGMRKADYQIVSEGQQAEVTVMDFAATTGMADPLGNVNRWRGQVGLGAIDQTELEESAEAIEIASEPATFVELFSPDGSAQSLGTLAAMTQRNGKIWFFKLTGDRDVVESQREKFREFLSKVRFASANGEDNGDD